MPPPKREPGWVQPFLAALGSCGNVTRSAALAGVDVTGPYNRRARYPEFRDAWERVIAAREARASGSVDTVTLPLTGSGQAHPSAVFDISSPPAPAGGGSLVLAGAGVRRGSAGRWSRQAEERFLAELTASANVARAAAAAGFSAAAIYRRKLRDPHFAQGWEAAIAVGRSRLEAHLLAAAERSFDPAGLPIAEGAPRVTVGEALGILRHRPAVAAGGDGFATYRQQGEAMHADELAAVRERIFEKLGRVRERDEGRKLEQGWTRDGEDWIPPGWVRG